MMLVEGQHLLRLFDRPVREGEIIAESQLTGNTYRVTRWFDHGDGRITAIRKELVEDADRRGGPE